MNEREFVKFASRYYQQASPARAAEALGFVANVPWVRDATARRTAVYFFCRLAQLHPSRAVRASLRDAGERFIGEVLEAIQRALPEADTALRNPIRSPSDTELYWTEFYIRGDAEPVRRIVELLDRPDWLRTLLDRWLATPQAVGMPGVAPWRRRTLARLENFGIVCDSEPARVANEDDLDCFVLLDGLRPTDERLEQSKRALPVALLPEDLEDARLKGIGVVGAREQRGQSPPVGHCLSYGVRAGCARCMLGRGYDRPLAIRPRGRFGQYAHHVPTSPGQVLAISAASPCVR